MEIAYYGDTFVNINDPVIPIQERGHQFGDGVYEVIRVYNGSPFLLDEHLNRLDKSAEAIQLKLPYSRGELVAIIKEGLKRSSIQEAEIYIQITRGISARTHYFPDVAAQFSMTIKEARITTVEKRKEGIAILLTKDERWANCYIKSLNLLPNVLAKQKAVASGYDEAVFIKNGFITEGSSSNIFVVKDGKLYTTPATKGILHGITRGVVIQLAIEEKIEVIEDHFDVSFLQTADEAFITSTSVELLPINNIDRKNFLPAERPITNKLFDQFQQLYL